MEKRPTRLRRAPLVHVLAQVAFPPIPEWTDRVASLGAGFHEAGFPISQPSRREEVVFGLKDGGVPPDVQHQTIHVASFLDRDQRFAFQLWNSSLVLHTTAYQSFGHFAGMLQSGLQVLRAVMGPQSVHRIGLRYVDLVQAHDGENLSEYVTPGVMGFPFKALPDLGIKGVAINSHAVGLTQHGALAVRTLTLPPGQFLPPDLETGGLRVPAHADPSRPGLAVDFDHYSVFAGNGVESSQPIPFDVADICQRVTELHDGLKLAFLAAVTDAALERWGGWEDVQ
jgi:uncharacterized protein (TIGR04255 family)